MKALCALLLSAALTLSCAAQEKKPEAGADDAIRQYLPQKSVKASLMRLAFDKSAHEIAERFNKAVAESPAWFQGYLADNAGVKPLPYHKNFGITEEEYKAMLDSFEKRRLEKVCDSYLLAKSDEDGSLRLSSPQLGKLFSELRVDPKSGKLQTPWMEIEKPDPKNSGSAADGNPYGDWKGVSWKKTQSDPAKGEFVSVSLIIGRSKTTKASFLAYRVKTMKGNKIETNFESILQLDGN